MVADRRPSAHKPTSTGPMCDPSAASSPPSSLCVAVRNIAKRDFRAIQLIDGLAFGGNYIDLDQLHHVYRLRSVVFRMAVIDGTPVAYCSVALHKGMYEVTRIAVIPDLQRRGIGAVLVDELRAKLRLREGRRSMIVAAVPDSNLNGMLFFRAMGFRCVGAMEHSSEPDETLRVMEFNVLGWVKERRELLAGECSGA